MRDYLLLSGEISRHKEALARYEPPQGDISQKDVSPFTTEQLDERYDCHLGLQFPKQMNVFQKSSRKWSKTPLATGEAKISSPVGGKAGSSSAESTGRHA